MERSSTHFAGKAFLGCMFSERIFVTEDSFVAEKVSQHWGANSDPIPLGSLLILLVDADRDARLVLICWLCLLANLWSLLTQKRVVVAQDEHSRQLLNQETNLNFS